MPKAKAETNSNQLICETLTNHLSFDHLFQVCFLMNIFGKRSDLPFFTQEEKRVVSFYLRIEQNIINFAVLHAVSCFTAIAISPNRPSLLRYIVCNYVN